MLRPREQPPLPSRHPELEHAVQQLGTRRVRRRQAQAVGLVALTALVGWTAFETWRAYSGAHEATTAAQTIRTAVKTKSWSQLPAAGRHLQHGAGRLAAASSSPPMRVLAWLPVVGDDVRAVRISGAALDSAAGDARPLLDQGAAADPRTLLTGGGSIDLARLQRITPALTVLAQGLTTSRASLDNIDVRSLSGPLRRRLEPLRADLDRIQPSVQLAADAAKVLPTMLGSTTPQTYLLALQNPAEARPTGGIIGSYGVLQASRGKVELVAEGVNNDLDQLHRADLAGLDPGVLALYGDDLSLSPNYNLSPDFSVAARLFARQWISNGHPVPQGVISLDPLVLQAILAKTGPITVKGGPALNGRNAAGVLMDRAYRELGGNTDARNSYLRSSTKAVFDKMLTPGTDVVSVLTSLAQPAVRSHLMMWSPDSKVNAVFDQAGVTGPLAGADPLSIGVFTTNADASKLDYFLHRQVVVTDACQGNGSRVTLVLRNDSPRSVPAYSANKLAGQRPTDHTVTVSWFLPDQRGLLRVTVDGATRAYALGPEGDWRVVRLSVTIPRGHTTKVGLELSGAYVPVGSVLQQPGASSSPVSHVPCAG
jgi:hypothetical protein